MSTKFWIFLAAAVYTTIGIFLLKKVDKLSKAFFESNNAFKKALGIRTDNNEAKSILVIKVFIFIIGGSFLAVGILSFFIFIGAS